MAIDQGAGAGQLSVGQLAEWAGVRTDTIRFYERIGLLPVPARTEGDHRRYGPADVDRLLFIRGAQRLGLRLAEIRGLIAVRDTGVCPCGPAETLLRRHLDETDREIGRLTGLRGQLTAMLDGLAGPASCPEPEPGTWRAPARKEGRRPAAEGGDHDVLVLR
ncbi:MAG TPA: MerR family transcriptional regulator [Trebonia sp.]|jgi:DNA-binding transcriptional MerR regulator|nr:MerR family transcriptional regulator [Trebonia sp.]